MGMSCLGIWISIRDSIKLATTEACAAFESAWPPGSIMAARGSPSSACFGFFWSDAASSCRRGARSRSERGARRRAPHDLGGKTPAPPCPSLLLRPIPPPHPTHRGRRPCDRCIFINPIRHLFVCAARPGPPPRVLCPAASKGGRARERQVGPARSNAVAAARRPRAWAATTGLAARRWPHHHRPGPLPCLPTSGAGPGAPICW